MQNIICDDKYNNNNNNRFVMTTNKWKNDKVQNLTTKMCGKAQHVAVNNWPSSKQ